MDNFLQTEMVCEVKQRETSVSRSVSYYTQALGGLPMWEGPPMEHPLQGRPCSLLPTILTSPAGRKAIQF